MKILLALVIVLGCGYIGWGFSQYYKSRVNFFSAFSQQLCIAKNQIVFEHKKLKDVFEQMMKCDCVALGVLCKNYISYLSDKDCILSQTKLYQDIHILKKDEKSSMFNLFSSLGRQDSEGESDIFESYIEILKANEKSCLSIYNKFGRLLTKLGFMAGCALAILVL